MSRRVPRSPHEAAASKKRERNNLDLTEIRRIVSNTLIINRFNPVSALDPLISHSDYNLTPLFQLLTILLSNHNNHWEMPHTKFHI